MDDGAAQSAPDKAASKGRLPVWARAIVAFVLVVFGASTYGVFRLADAIGIMARDAIDPRKMPGVARDIGEFPQPLPAGYKYEYASRLPVPTVQISHQPDNQLMQFLCYPNTGDDDPEFFLSRAIDLSDTALPSLAPNKIHSVKSKGEEVIDKRRMAYIVGEFYDEKKRSVEGLIGCICIKEKRKTILIYALEPSGTPYNLQVTMDLLKSIKSFETATKGDLNE